MKLLLLKNEKILFRTYVKEPGINTSLKRTALIVIISIFLFSCKKESDTPAPVDFGYDYFPLVTGHTNYYSVTFINIDSQSNVYDTTNYYLKTEIDTPYYDNYNKLIYPINRYTKDSVTDPWIIKDVWFAYFRFFQLIVSEENVHFLKLAFPLEDNKTWNGNTFNTNEAQDYKITEYAIPYSLNGVSYDSTVTVNERDETTLINKFYRYEVYSKGTGLIELSDINIYESTYNFSLPIEQRIVRGTIYRQVRVEL